MKRVLFILFASIIYLALFSCKKANVSAPAKSQWVANGNAYTADSTSFSYSPSFYNAYSPYMLESLDASGNSITIFFAAPPTSRSYNTLVAHPYINPNNDSTCFIYIDGHQIGYYSTENVKNIINVTLPNGKIKVSFQNIEVQIDNNGLPETATASGTIIQP